MTRFEELRKRVPVKQIGNGTIPQYKTEGASCLDCYARVEHHTEVIFPNERAIIPLGFALALPEGYEAIIRPRSGFSKAGVDIAIGTIDCDYRGEVKACVINNSPNRLVIQHGERICQMKIQRSEKFVLLEVDELDETKRGANGFGSTGTEG